MQLMRGIEKIRRTNKWWRIISWRIQEFRRESLGFYRILNPSIVDYNNQRLIAFRDYCPFRNYIRIGCLNGKRISNVKVILGEEGVWGAEDPRFFLYKDKLHLSYVKTRWDLRAAPGGYAKMAYCALNDELSPVGHRVFDEFEGIQKNWLFFEDLNHKLYAIIYNHNQQVLDLEKNKLIDNDFEIQWPVAKKSDSLNVHDQTAIGMVRGGTTPICVDGQFYSFFHVTPLDPLTKARMLDYCYEIGFYSFEASPPFRVIAFTPDPLMIGNPIILPFGVIFRNGRWTVSCGLNDRTWGLYDFDHNQLLENMISVG